MDRTSNPNNQQLLVMWQNTHGIPKYQYWFRAILGRFSNNNKIPSETWTHPPTHFHSNIGFLGKQFLCKASKDLGWKCNFEKICLEIVMEGDRLSVAHSIKSHSTIIENNYVADIPTCIQKFTCIHNMHIACIHTLWTEENKLYLYYSVLPRLLLQGAAPCPFFVTPCPFEKAEMTPCPFD